MSNRPKTPMLNHSPAENETAPQQSALMSDDDFLQTLLTPLETTPLNTQDEESSESDQPSEAAEEELPWSLNPKMQSVPRQERFPFNFTWIQELDLQFDNTVTFFVGENGSGKSTLLEAIAQMSGFPVWGGGRNDLTDRFGPERESELAQALYPHFRKRPRDGYFFRAEYYAQFASLLDQRVKDRDFKGDPYGRYGGQSLHTRSHGESFMALIQNRLTDGLFLLDEPESALSPQRQLTLLATMVDRVRKGNSQFIIATHSPIMLTFPGAKVISFDAEQLEPIDFRETHHYQLTQDLLNHPDRYWQHLIKDQ